MPFQCIYHYKGNNIITDLVGRHVGNSFPDVLLVHSSTHPMFGFYDYREKVIAVLTAEDIL